MATTFAVPDGRVAMAATLYTGTGTISQAVSNAVNTVSFQPDLVWVKARSASASNSLYDSIRGTKKFLASNTSDAEIDFSPYGVTTFGSSGFTVGDISSGFYYCNGSGITYVGWQWKAGGTAVSNTAGTITSSVSANTTAGFSVVTYTGTGVAATIGHGLGVAPSLVMCKTRSSAQGFIVYHSALGATQFLGLTNTSAAVTSSAAWNNTAPTNSVFSVGVNSGTGGLTDPYVAYCWAPVAGYSAFGSYTGNGSADGPFIYTGFRPRFILYKGYSAAGYDWVMYDTSRNPTNASALQLYSNTSQADYTGGPIDILSNGFKIRSVLNADNASGTSYIYAAFAENPLKYANAR